MNKQDQKIYNSIVRIIFRDDNYDKEQDRYISDLSDSFLFYYKDTGKILQSKSGRLKTVFRDKNTAWMLAGKLKQLLNEIEC